MADNPNTGAAPAPEDPEKERLRKEKKAEKDAAKAAKVAKALAKQEKEKAAKEQKEKAAKEQQETATPSEPKKDIRLKKTFVHTTAPGEKKDLSSFPLDAESSYDPPAVEAAWYQWWEKQGFFNPDITNNDGEVFSIVIPPPNVTGSLHLGHALTNSIQDCIVRFHRMNGKRVIWVPGTDHAGIATQAVVEKKLWKQEKKTRQDMKREDFVARVWEWKSQYGNRITDQLRRIGSSLDWSRERFTLDERLSRGVVEAFVQLSRRGKIYRGTRLVNWSCKLRTAISDVEVEPMELTKKTKMKIPGHNPDKLYEFGAIWEFAYKIDGSDEELVVATTRPETMLGDTAVAVHPDDARYKHLIGKFVKHPFIPEREIPVIGDRDLVDMNFGTGVVKITPAHDPNDFACGERHGLKRINILNLDGTINHNGGKFAGMMRFDARIAVLGDLKALGLYKGVKDNAMNIGKCSRSGDIIEPMLVPQWWVKCGDMAQAGLDAVKTGQLEIVPEMHVATWNTWLSDIRDWCVSRQLWWGHRIPAWLVHLKGQAPSNPATEDFWVVAHDEAEARQIAEQKWPGQVDRLDQDPDVLDTWFSSGIFPFSVFGWPDNKDAPESDIKDLAQFYPTSLLETGHDILFFWVARMVMMGLELTGKLPFKQVLLHAMVRDAHGRKMSKSLGNVVDPIDVMEGITKAAMIEKLKEGNLEDAEIAKATQGINEDYPNGISECGTDALRFALCAYTSQGRDINLDILRVQAYRNFCNKIWNATKLGFMVMGLLPNPSRAPHVAPAFHPRSSASATTGKESLVDKWVLSRLQSAISESWEGFASYDFAKVTSAIYSFWLYDFCDVYLEAVKPIAFATTNPDLEAIEAVRQTIYTCLDEGLRLLHPFMPFLSEDLWQRIERRPDQTNIVSITLAPYPAKNAARTEKGIEAEVSAAQVVIGAVRNMRSEYNIAKKISPPLVINVHSEEYREIYGRHIELIKVLSYSGEVAINLNGEIPPASAASIPNATCGAYLLIKGLVNIEQEVSKLTGKIANVNKQIDALNKKMGMATYANVPENVKATDKTKLQTLETELSNLKIAISNFEKLN